MISQVRQILKILYLRNQQRIQQRTSVQLILRKDLVQVLDFYLLVDSGMYFN
nr:MAG TPA: hypothetical protein [Bacteriophage sp.]